MWESCAIVWWVADWAATGHGFVRVLARDTVGPVDLLSSG